jgi:Na+/melibiose symporter-like transporter
MFDNLMLVAGLIAIFWIACFLFYMVTSRQQKKIAGQIEQLNQQLENKTESLN